MEMLINLCPRICAVDFPPDFGKNTHNTTSIPAFFAYASRKIYRLI
jgi:hypothetical protein